MKAKILNKIISQNKLISKKTAKLNECCLCNKPSDRKDCKFLIINADSKIKIYANKFANKAYNYTINMFMDYISKKYKKSFPKNFVFIFTVCSVCDKKDIYQPYFNNLNICSALQGPPIYSFYDLKYSKYLEQKHLSRETRILICNFFYPYRLISSIVKLNGKPYIFERKLWERYEIKI